MVNEKSKGSPQYSEVFKEAIDRLPDVDAFITIVAGALDDIGASALKAWIELECKTKSKEEVAVIIRNIIDGGCYDEHEFRIAVAEKFPDTFRENERSSESCTSRRRSASSDSRKEKVNTFVSLFEEHSKKDSFCKELEEFRDKIETEIKASTLAAHANSIIIRGNKLTGKTRLIKSIADRMSDQKITVIQFKDAVARGERSISGDNRRYLVVCDDFDSEAIGDPTFEIKGEKLFRSSKATFLFTMSDTSRSVLMAKNSHVYEIPTVSMESMAEILSEHIIREKKLKIECCRSLVGYLGTHSSAERLQEHAFHALRLVMLKYMTTLSEDINKFATIEVSDDDIKEAAESVLGVSFKLESASECRKKIEEELIGQRTTINRIVPFLDIIHSGFSDPEKPLGVFLFYGPSGVGKTELAKVVANSMFSGRYYKEDMNTYSERHSVSRLIGSPPGYVGHGESSALMKFIDKEPSGVILLDEIEKAHQDVREALMELMDTGFMRDAAGRLHDARRFLIIMTSNISVREKEKSVTGIGFGKAVDAKKSEIVAATNDREDREYLVSDGTFTKELIGRIQLVSKFSTFSSEEKTEVARRLVRKAAGRLTKFFESRGSDITSDEVETYAKDALAYYSDATGARGMKTYIDTTVTSKILGIVKE